MKDLISIVIPCFNAERYIAATIKSCLRQTYPNLEIIIVNDGSTDNSLQIAKEYCEHHANLQVISIENHGQCYARNVGLKLAQGKYIKFLDSDDLLFPISIEEQQKALTLNQADLCICGSIPFQDYNAEYNKRYKISKSSKQIIYNSFLECIQTVHNSYNNYLISREKVLEVGGFESSLGAAEEVNLNLKLAIRFPEIKAVKQAKTLLLKRVHYDSVAVQAKTQKEIPHSLLSLQNAAEYYLKSQNNPNQDLKRFIFDKLYFQLIYAYRSSKLHYVPPAFEIWKSANLPSPPLNPLYHHVFHRYLGFWRAEELLDILRKFKNKLPIFK